MRFFVELAERCIDKLCCAAIQVVGHYCMRRAMDAMECRRDGVEGPESYAVLSLGAWSAAVRCCLNGTESRRPAWAGAPIPSQRFLTSVAVASTDVHEMPPHLSLTLLPLLLVTPQPLSPFWLRSELAKGESNEEALVG